MASDCQVLIDNCSRANAERLFALCKNEALRIETKFSRYRDDNLVYKINNSPNQPVPLDPESLQLLSFADTCFSLSNGLFDITSGVLRQIWRFTEGEKPPDQYLIDEALKKIGWDKIKIDRNSITIPKGMEIDLGGIGKEYAVDRCASLVSQQFDISFALNFGGDVFVNRKRANNQCWKIGIETPTDTPQHINSITLSNGGIATSGTTKRFFLSNGKRYGHILNPKTGKPVEYAPLSVTVIGENCTQAGMLATFAMLHGEQAEEFLKDQAVRFWVYR